MIFTIEDIKRLIPEADVIETYPIEYLGSPPRYELLWDGLRINVSSHWIQALLTTRRQLEIAMEVLREVNASTSSSRLRRVTAEALKSIKKVGVE